MLLNGVQQEAWIWVIRHRLEVPRIAPDLESGIASNNSRAKSDRLGAPHDVEIHQAIESLRA